MKNRTLIGIVCIILAVVVTFIVSPFINKMTEGKTEVICLKTDVSKGALLTENDIQPVELARSGIPEGAIKDKNEVVGKYAKSDLYKGDVATSAKLSDTADSSANILSALGDGKLAMSITIESFAGGLSGKLENGDVISIYVTDKDGNTSVPPTLKYVRVITTTTSGGVDGNDVVPNEDGTFDLPATVTVLISVKQAAEIANYEKNASMHVALVYRGDSVTAEKFIETQDRYIDELTSQAETETEGETNG